MDFFRNLKEKIIPANKEQFIMIIPRVYSMNYPSKERISSL